MCLVVVTWSKLEIFISRIQNHTNLLVSLSNPESLQLVACLSAISTPHDIGPDFVCLRQWQ